MIGTWVNEETETETPGLDELRTSPKRYFDNLGSGPASMRQGLTEEDCNKIAMSSGDEFEHSPEHNSRYLEKEEAFRAACHGGKNKSGLFPGFSESGKIYSATPCRATRTPSFL
eukprot:gene13408-3919_t